MGRLPAAPTAMVTGSTRGIGRAIARKLAERGVHVLVHGGRDEQAAQSVSAELQQLGVHSSVLMADLRSASEVDRLVASAWQWRDGVDIWINNAGADVLTGDAAALRFEQKLELLWQVDVLGTLRCARDVGQRMRDRGSGVIINMGWDQAFTGMEGESGEMFATVKAAVMAFSQSLAKSLAPDVRVNCLAPGWIRTAWGAEQASAYWQARAIDECLRGRWGTAEDVASAAAFLASNEADFVNSHILPVNGGFDTRPQEDAPKA